jgi:hypothetical protein
MKISKLVAGLVVAALVSLPAALASDKAAGKTHEATVTVVSVDTNAKTITFKDDQGNEKTAPVMDKALNGLDKWKAGEKVTLTCQDASDGTHQGVTEIKKAKA